MERGNQEDRLKEEVSILTSLKDQIRLNQGKNYRVNYTVEQKWKRKELNIGET